jgi:hypothetical protein
LQAGVAELIRRADGAQNIPLARILEESHETHRSAPLQGELGRGER